MTTCVPCIADHVALEDWPVLCPKPIGGVAIWSYFMNYYDSQNGDKNAGWYLSLVELCDDYADYVSARFTVILNAYDNLSEDELTKIEASYEVYVIQTKIAEVNSRFLDDAYSGRALIPDTWYNNYKDSL